MNTNLQNMDQLVKDSVDLNQEFSKLAQKLRTLGNQKDIAHCSEILFQAYLESDFAKPTDGSYLLFYYIKPLIELSFEGDPTAPSIYTKSEADSGFDGKSHLKTWKDFYRAFVTSSYLENGYKVEDLKIYLSIYEEIENFMQLSILKREDDHRQFIENKKLDADEKIKRLKKENDDLQNQIISALEQNVHQQKEIGKLRDELRSVAQKTSKKK